MAVTSTFAAGAAGAEVAVDEADDGEAEGAAGALGAAVAVDAVAAVVGVACAAFAGPPKIACLILSKIPMIGFLPCEPSRRRCQRAPAWPVSPLRQCGRMGMVANRREEERPVKTRIN